MVVCLLLPWVEVFRTILRLTLLVLVRMLLVLLLLLLAVSSLPRRLTDWATSTLLLMTARESALPPARAVIGTTAVVPPKFTAAAAETKSVWIDKNSRLPYCVAEVALVVRAVDNVLQQFAIHPRGHESRLTSPCRMSEERLRWIAKYFPIPKGRLPQQEEVVQRNEVVEKVLSKSNLELGQ